MLAVIPSTGSNERVQQLRRSKAALRRTTRKGSYGRKNGVAARRPLEGATHGGFATPRACGATRDEQGMSQIEVDDEMKDGRAPTRRALAKQQTRTRVLAAARRLFGEHGYEGATIRDIAAAADMSTGAVFANFADKSDLFREIVTADLACIMAAMQAAAAEGGKIEDVLLRMYRAGYVIYQGQLPLARAAFSYAWSPVTGFDSDPGHGIDVLFRRQIELAVERGELRKDPEARLRSEMLYESYAANFVRMIRQGVTLEAVLERSRVQIRILLTGLRPY